MTLSFLVLAALAIGPAPQSTCDRPASDRQVSIGEQQTDASRMEEHAKAAIGLCAASAKAHNLLGNAREMRGDLQGAQAAYETAKGHDGAWYLPVLGLADVARKQGRHDEAQALYKSARALAGSDPERRQVDQSMALLDANRGGAYAFKSAEALSRSFRIGEKLTQASGAGAAPANSPGGSGIGMPGAVVRDPSAAAPVNAPSGARVLGDGVYQMAEGTVVAHLDITYFVNSTRMTPDGVKQAKAVASALAGVNGTERFTIEGHASTEGDAALNLSLSEARAAAFRDYLVAAGIPRAIFEVRGFGSANPVMENGAENRDKSRRATLVRRQ